MPDPTLGRNDWSQNQASDALGLGTIPQRPTDTEVRLVYVEDCWAWFAENTADAWGDDWNDAPHDCNAGTPYDDRGGYKIKVAFDGDLEVAGTQWGSYPAFHPPAPKHGLSVEEINDGAAPWLYQPSYGLKQFPEPLMVIPAGVTLVEFEQLVAQAGGKVYR